MKGNVSFRYKIDLGNKQIGTARYHNYHNLEGGVRVCGITVLGYFWCGVAVIFI